MTIFINLVSEWLSDLSRVTQHGSDSEGIQTQT